ncbi:hypothetical protein DFP73DRAFT_567211 [Morchella snyderi]|nr:hypothetical protein DFP73DRAFT_567211 [Morchella snyderi]
MPPKNGRSWGCMSQQVATGPRSPLTIPPLPRRAAQAPSSLQFRPPLPPQTIMTNKYVSLPSPPPSQDAADTGRASTTTSLTAAVLMRAMDLLEHETSPAQHALLSPEERKAALQQLMVTVETAAKLADIGHVEATAAAAKHSATGAETERFKADAAKIRNEVERVMAETERAKVGAKRVWGEAERMWVDAESVWDETERQTAAAGPPETAAPPTKAEVPSVPPSTPGELLPVPPPVPLYEPGIYVIGLSQSHKKMKEIIEASKSWNESNIEEYTLAGWAWFKHSKLFAFLLLERPGGGQTTLTNRARGRTGTFELPYDVFMELCRDEGYDGIIEGPRNKTGSRDHVRFV